MNINDKETFIFDLDGVLIDSLDDLCSSVNHTLRSFGMKGISNEVLRGYIGKGNRNLIKQALDTEDAEMTDKALTVFMDHYAQNCTNRTVLRKGVHETLDRIKDMNLAVLSNKFTSLTEIIIKKLKIYDYFGIILGPDRLTKMKPDPEGIRRIIEFFCSSTDKTVMIGDSDMDITTGKNAGVMTCGVLGGIGDEQKLLGSKPDIIINEVSELFDSVCIANI
jgi:phosphoglycolate phosphatase